MIRYILQNKLLFIIAFIIIGYLGTLPFFPLLFGFLCVVIPIIVIFNTKNIEEEALIFTAFIVGAEVFIRMTKGFILYETGKYAAILFLLMGLALGKLKQQFSLQYIAYLFFLLIGILFTKVPEGESLRKEIIFNLSGPVVLGIAAIYFYNRPIKKQKLLDALFFMLLPIFSIVVYLFFRTPDIEEIVFGGAANFQTSGGFGPNQVATAIGIGIFVLTIFIILKEKISGFIILDYIFLTYFIYRGLLTFSRGGILTAVISVLLFAIFYLIFKKISFGVFIKYLFTTVFFILAIWLYTSDITKGMLNNRYTGKNASGVQKSDITTGRADIFQLQYDNFIDNPLGIGVGNGKYERKYTGKSITAASHNEVGRLLEEHGYIGFFLLLLLIIVPLFNFFRSNYYQKAFIIAFYLMWFLTINHSAMRIALAGFVYALSLIIITDINDD